MKRSIKIQFLLLVLLLGPIDATSSELPLSVSPHLANYVDKVIQQTGRQMVVERRSLPFGLKAAFVPDPQFIKIVLDPIVDLKTDYAEQAIAHELTHGLLVYAKGYSQLIPKRSLTAREQKHRNIAEVIVQDLVVARIMQTEGFSPYSPIYLASVQQETKFANARQIYRMQDFADDEEGRDRWMVLRYIVAWGLIEYCSLDEKPTEVITEYLRAFENGYPKQFSQAEQVKNIIKRTDIFEPQGYRKTMAGILELWKLNNFLQISATGFIIDTERKIS